MLSEEEEGRGVGVVGVEPEPEPGTEPEAGNAAPAAAVSGGSLERWANCVAKRAGKATARDWSDTEGRGAKRWGSLCVCAEEGVGVGRDAWKKLRGFWWHTIGSAVT